MKPLFRTPAFLVVLVFCALGLGSCSQQNNSASGSSPNESVAPKTPLDLEIDSYEKTAKEYVRVTRQKQTGDVSVTMRYLSLRDQTRADAKKVQAQTARMNPAQQKRVALISSRTAPFLTE